VLLGIGVALAVFAAGLRFYVTPIATNIPYDLKPSTTIAEASNGQYINTTNGQIETGTLQSFTYVVPQPVLTRDKLTGDLKGKAVVWDVYSQLLDTSNGTVILPASQEIALDRKTGEVVKWDGAWSNSTGTQEPNTVTGYSYKLPFNAEKKTYPYWDDQLGRTLDIDYKGTDTVSGLQAYRYEQKPVDSETIPWNTDQLNLLRAVFRGGSGDVHYSVSRTIWVEPVTGQYLNVKQSVKLEFIGGNGSKTTLLAGDFEYTDASKANSASDVKSNRSQILLVSQYLPLAGGAGGLILLAVGIVLIVMAGTRRAGEPAAATASASSGTASSA
jgi:hypothetical protein